MAKRIARDWHLTVGGVDLSDHVQSLQEVRGRDEIDLTAMGATVREFGAGLADFSLDVTFFADWAAGSVNPTLETAFNTPDSTTAVVWRPSKTDAISTSNPEYTMQAKLFGFGQGAAVGEAEMIPVTFRNATPAGISKDTTP